jgi:hypothetical protein
VIRAGGADSIAAAHAIPYLSKDRRARQEFAREGTVRSLLRICCMASGTGLEGYTALKTCFSKSPGAVTQYIAEFSDADPQNIVAAVITVQKVLNFDSQVRKRLLDDEGFTASIVGLLSTPSSHFHSFIVWTTVCIVSMWPGQCQGLLKAGLVRELLRILGNGRLPEPPQQLADGISASLDDCYVRIMGVEALAGIRSHPAACACTGLIGLITMFPEVEREVSETKNLASTFVSCLNQFADLEDAQTQFLSCIYTIVHVNRVTSDAGKRSFARELVSLGFADIVLSLIRPMQKDTFEAVVRVISLLVVFMGKDGIPLGTSRAFVAALVRYIEDDGDEFGMAGWVITRFDLWTDPTKWSEIANSEGLVKKFMRQMVMGEAMDSVNHHTPILELVLNDAGTELLRMAVSAGFVPGSLRLLRAEDADSSKRSADDKRGWALFYERLRDSLMCVIALNEPRFIHQAIRCGLLRVLHDAIFQYTGLSNEEVSQHTGLSEEELPLYMHKVQLFVLFCITNLTEHPEALKAMRKVGLWPYGFMQLASSRVADFLEVYIAVLLRLVTHRPSLATELLATDFVKGSSCLHLLRMFVNSCEFPTQGKLRTDVDFLESWVEANKQAIGKVAYRIRRGERIEVRWPEAFGGSALSPVGIARFWGIASLRVNLSFVQDVSLFPRAFSVALSAW